MIYITKEGLSDELNGQSRKVEVGKNREPDLAEMLSPVLALHYVRIKSFLFKRKSKMFMWMIPF